MMLGMKNLKPIRKRLGLTQQALGQVIGCTQGNVGYYEHGQAMPTPRARLLIEYANGLGLPLTFDHLYGDLPLPELAQPTPAGEEVRHG